MITDGFELKLSKEVELKDIEKISNGLKMFLDYCREQDLTLNQGMSIAVNLMAKAYASFVAQKNDKQLIKIAVASVAASFEEALLLSLEEKNHLERSEDASVE